MEAPVLTWPAELLLRAQGMRVAIFDVDGVLTDGGLYCSETGEGFKRFHTLDGYGVRALARAGIVPVVISGRDSNALRARLETLGVANFRLGSDEKLPAAEALLVELGVDWTQVAAIGDDWPDLPVLRRAGFSCAPPNAHAEVRARVDHVTALPGGMGAAREFCDLLLVAGGHYRRLLEDAWGAT